MSIDVTMLDKFIKSDIRGTILKKLIKENGTLPLANETDKILSTLTEEFTKSLDEAVKNYYKDFFESESVEVSISKEEYMNVYLKRI